MSQQATPSKQAQWRRMTIVSIVKYGVILSMLWLTVQSAAPVLAQAPTSYAYVVQPGDSWRSIARLTGVPVTELQVNNPQAMRSSGLRAGEELTIPTRPLASTHLHVVQPGESWHSIADDYAVATALLLAVNPQHRTPSLELSLGVTLLIPNPSPLEQLTYLLPVATPSPPGIALTETLSVTVANFTTTNPLAMNLLLNNSVAACQQRGNSLRNGVRHSPVVRPKVLTIDEVHVTQSIVPADHRYIVDRSTAILVDLAPGPAFSTPISVTGCIHLYANGLFSQTIAARGIVQLSTANAQIVFEPLVLPYFEDIDLDVEIIDATNPLTRLYDIDSGGNFRFILDSVEPILFYVPINMEGVGPPAPDTIKSKQGDAMLRAILPVSDQQAWHYEAAGTTPRYFDDPNNDKMLTCDDPLEGNELFRQLVELREMVVQTYTRQLTAGGLVTASIGSMEHIILYGWVADPNGQGTVPCYGYTEIGLKTAFGSTRPTTGQRTYAHEVFHQVHNDRGHLGITTTITQAGWDVDNHLVGNWQLLNLEQGKPTGTTAALMTAADQNPTDKTWITNADYHKALTYVCAVDLLDFTSHFQECPQRIDGQGPPCLSQDNYIISGEWDRSGTELLTEYTRIFQSPWYSQPTYTYLNQGNRPLPFGMLFFQGEQLLAEIPFDAEIHTEQLLQEVVAVPRYGVFNVVVPPFLVDQADRIVIRNRNGDLIPLLTRSPNLPTIQILAPAPVTSGGFQGEAPLDNLVTIQTTDADPADTLTCRFAYSPDQGATWQPLQVRPEAAGENIYASRITVPCRAQAEQRFLIADANQLPPSTTGGILRAFVSDGFHVEQTDVNVVVAPLEIR